MNIESSVIFHRVARIACLVLTAGLLDGSVAMAQLPISFTPGNPPPVLSGSVIPFNHGATGVWNQVYEIQESPNGNILFLDSANSDIYQMAPGASLPTHVAGPGPNTEGANTCATLETSGSYWNAGIGFDSANNLFVGNRYSGVAEFCRIPYNASSNSWDFNSNDTWGPPTYVISGTSEPIYPQYIYIPPCTGSCTTNTMYVSTSGAIDKSIYEITFTVATGAIGTITQLITGLEDFAANVTTDHAGNVFFVENIYPTPVGERVTGIREIPAGTSGIVGSGNGAAETADTLLVGNSNTFTGINGITFDAQGNLYFSTEYNTSYGGYTSGVFMIPNEGTPASPNLVWADTIMIAPVYAGQQPFVDPRGLIWVATGGSGNWSAPGGSAQNCDTTSVQTVDATCLSSTVLIWKPGMANVGSAAVGGTAPAKITAFSVPASGGSLTLTANNSFAENQVVTFTAGPSDPLYPLNGLSFYVNGSPLSGTEFQVSIPTTSTDPGYIAGGSSGSSSATATLTPFATMYYTFNAATTPATGSFIPSNKNFTSVSNPIPNTGNLAADEPTPPQACTAGTTYPAWAPEEQSNSQFSWCSVFLELSTQTAGLVGADIQMFNSSGGVISGSNTYLTGVGQGAAVSSLSTPLESSIASGFSEPEQVASDAQGDTYVADAGLKTIEYYAAGTSAATTSTTNLGTGLSAPTGVAVDLAGDVYIGDSGKVYIIPFINGALATSKQTEIASGLGSDLSLAVDNMGDVFMADKTNKQVVELANPQSQLLRQNLPPLQTLASSAGFTGPSAIATDNSGNVWVADGNNLWEITMPFGGATEITSKLAAPVTGLAVDPSGSVFVSDANGIVWIPYQVTSTSSGLNVNGAVSVASGLGSSNSELPISVALDGLANVYADYGSSSTAGLSQLSINGAVNFNNFYAEINPAVPYEADAQLFNVGNTPLTLAALSNDAITQPNAGEFSVVEATLNSPACGPSTSTSPGSSCYLGFDILDSLTPPAGVGATDASATVASNAANATAGLNLALSANIVQDFRPASNIVVTFAPASGTGCSGASTYPGCETATVTVTSSSGTPQGTAIIKVPGSGISQDDQTCTLSASGTCTFSFTNLSGGSYNVLATYGGEGTAGSTLDSCSSGTPVCFAGSAYTTTFTIARAKPTFAVGPPGNENCLSWTQGESCTPDPEIVQLYLGTYFIQAGQGGWFTASVTSNVGTPTGSVSFLENGQPIDATQAQNSLNATGIADFSLINLPTAVYNVTAQYNGDQNYASETVTLPTFEVIPQSIQITASPSSVTTTAGTPVTATLNLMPLVGFSNNVSLECVSASLPQYSECTFAYSSTSNGTVAVGANGATPSTIVVTISTNVPVNSGSASIARKAQWALAGLFGLGLLGLIAGRKRLNRYLAMICLAMMLSGAFMAVTSCTNAGYSTPPAAPKVITPANTYNVQIITYNPGTMQQNSLTAPVFTLPVQVSAQ